MRRKLLTLFFAAVLSIGSCFAAEQEIYEPMDPIIPAYVAADNVTSDLTISNGTASYYTKVYPQTATSITKVVGTVKLVNGKGTVVNKKTATATKSNGYFKITDTMKLSAKGTYHVEASMKVYKGTKLVETLSSKSRVVQY